jgi:quinol-cytochrome oxidoreductase complex cytochrome b subunit
MEGPQAALLVVTVLMGIWALVPWLDRRASRSQPSPKFTDLAIAAIIFMAYLTLKAWDIGGHPLPGKLPDPRSTAWTCAWITLGISAAIALLRLLAYRQRWMYFSGAALLQVVLNGVFGLDYLIAGAIALVVAIAGVVVKSRTEPAVHLGVPK